MLHDAALSLEKPKPLSNDPTLLAMLEKVTADSETPSKGNKAEKLVAFVRERAELFHDLNREAYATVHASGQTYKLGGSAFRDWLCAAALDELQMVSPDQSRREAIDALAGYARHHGEMREVFLRVGRAEHGAYVIDLGQPDNARAIVVEPGRWFITDQPPVRFVRNPDALPLPSPKPGGSLDPLWRVVNIPEDKRPLVLAWMLDCFRPETPYPVLELIGEEGTAKSTTQDALRQLIDPNHVNLRAAPKTREDLCTSAVVNHVVSYENLSHLSADMQDALCTVATGGGFSARRLYAQGEESTLKFKRPVVLNGIAAVITQQDLLSRAISIELPRITHRQMDADNRALFAQHKAGILGGLLDIFAQALRELPTVVINPADLPRMADFCKLGMAIAKAQGDNPQAFFTLYGESTRESIRRTIDASPVATAIMELVEKKPEGITAPAGRILAELETYRPDRCDAWPKTGKGLADALRRLSPALGKLGIEVKRRDDLSRRDGPQWQIAKSLKAGSRPSPPSPEMGEYHHRREHGDGGDDGSRDYVPHTGEVARYEEF